MLKERGRLYDLLKEVPFLRPFPSHSNFILCEVTSGKDAKKLKVNLPFLISVHINFFFLYLFIFSYKWLVQLLFGANFDTSFQFGIWFNWHLFCPPKWPFWSPYDNNHFKRIVVDNMLWRIVILIKLFANWDFLMIDEINPTSTV